MKHAWLCAKSRFGRACLRLRMSLSSLWLHHGLRGGCAAVEPEAVAGATPLFRCPLWHPGGLGCALPSISPVGSLRASDPVREGQPANRDGDVGTSIAQVVARDRGTTSPRWVTGAPPLRQELHSSGNSNRTALTGNPRHISWGFSPQDCRAFPLIRSGRAPVIYGVTGWRPCESAPAAARANDDEGHSNLRNGSLTAIQRKEQDMSTKYSTLSHTAHGPRPPRSRLLLLRWACALLISVSAAMGACSDAPTKPLDAPSGAPTANERLFQIANAIASAMNSADVRLEVLKAMRASPRVDHNLVLAEHLATPQAERLLEASATALNLTEEGFLAMVRGLPDLEFVVPFPAHRRSWTGTPRVAVGTYWDPDAPVFTIYELSGHSRHVEEVEPYGSYDALFVVRLRETNGTRIDRQDDVPGSVIQDPDDGQRAMVWTFQVNDHEPFLLDFGEFASAVERRRAMVDGIAAELQSHAPGLHVAAYDAGDDDDPIGDCEFDDDGECDGVGGGGGGGGGVENYETSDHDTNFDKLTLHRDLDRWGGDSEIHLTLSYKAAPNHLITATLEYNNVAEGETIDEIPDKLFLPVSPVQGGAKFWIKAVESDPGPDDKLGKFRLWWNDSGKELEFDENDDNVADLSVWLVWDSDEEDQ